MGHGSITVSPKASHDPNGVPYSYGNRKYRRAIPGQARKAAAIDRQMRIDKVLRQQRLNRLTSKKPRT